MRRAIPFAALTLTLVMAAEARGHFVLDTPAAVSAQDGFGNPQKSPPCGPNGAGDPTGIVSAYQSGTTITITIDETIFHPGHYRVALAVDDPSQLPEAPPITPSMSDECASTVIQDPPAFPVLADGMLAHSQPFDGPQSFEVTLPDDVTCENCTLQVIQYMSNHAAPCFYYHCAAIALQQEPVMTTSASSTGATGAGGSTGSATSGAGGDGGETGSGSGAGDSEDGGGCAFVEPGVGERGSSSLIALAGLGLLARRRRRRSR